MIPDVDFESTSAVAEFVLATFGRMYAAADGSWLRSLFADVDGLFRGRDPVYAPIDLSYHNLRHTLTATVCLTSLLEGRHSAAVEDQLKVRDFELAIAAVLLHDSGYLKLRSDTGGTGAKYTFCHILRSCAYVASNLPRMGVTDQEIESVVSAIYCTGPNSEIGRLSFRTSISRTIGCALATADYVGQMADPLYPDKLGDLFREFSESDSFANVPPERRVFKSEADLVARTLGFWHRFVKPKLENDFQGVYRFLARPDPSGANGYISAIEANLAKIAGRIAPP